MQIFPDVVALKKVTGSTTIASIVAGGTATATVTLNDTYLIIGMPKVSCSDTEVSLRVINGGKNEFVVEATNNGTTDKTNVVVNYEVYVLRGV